jgi:LemA protein
MKRWFALLAVTLALTGCGYNDFQRLDEQTRSAWSEVLNQYQRRADLVPNLVATVKGEAAFEQDTLTRVIEARAKATAMQVTPETLNNPQAFQRFQQAQGELSSALSRLLVVSERYPDLKANQGFRDRGLVRRRAVAAGLGAARAAHRTSRRLGWHLGRLGAWRWQLGRRRFPLRWWR